MRSLVLIDGQTVSNFEQTDCSQGCCNRYVGRPCRFCHTEISNRVHRTLRQKWILSAIYKCRVCGKYEHVFRFLPCLSSWLDDCLKGPWRETALVSAHKRRMVTERVLEAKQ